MAEQFRVLVIDDDPGVRDYMEALVSRQGYQVFAAADGEQGLEKLEETRPDLVTLDISMPESSGTRFYKELKSDPNLSGIPVVVVTAVSGEDGDPYGFRDIISNRQQVPAPEGYFPKPINKDEFLKVIRKLLS